MADMSSSWFAVVVPSEFVCFTIKTLRAECLLNECLCKPQMIRLQLQAFDIHSLTCVTSSNDKHVDASEDLTCTSPQVAVGIHPATSFSVD